MTLLHEEYLTYIIFGILIPISILQWCFVVPLAIKYDVFKSIKDNRLSEKRKVLIPFLDDRFFILWNIVPIIASIIYIIIWISWKRWSFYFLVHFSNVSSVYNACIQHILLNKVYICILVSVSLVACFIQIIKQRNFLQNNAYCYWWDWEISKVIYLIRLICLFFNMFSILLYGICFILLTIFVGKTVYTCEPVIMFLHPDNTGGFHFIGDICFWLSIAFTFGIGFSLVGLIDHLNQGLIHKITDISTLSICTILMFWVSLFPSIQLSKNLEKRYGEYKKNVALEIHKILNDKKNIGNKGISEPNQLINKERLLKYNKILSINFFSFSSALKQFLLLISISLPFIMRYFFISLKDVLKRENKLIEE